MFGSHVVEAECEDGGPTEPVQGRRRRRGGAASEGGQHGRDQEESSRGELAEKEARGHAGAAVPHLGPAICGREEGLLFYGLF